MRTKIIIALTIALSVGGCKTVKQAQSDLRMNTTQNSTVKESNIQHNDIELNIDSSKQVVDKGQVSEVVNEETTTTNYSAPDSSGKQHITSVVTTKRGVVRNEAKNLQENKQGKTNKADKSDYKSEKSDKSKSKTAHMVKTSSEQSTETDTPGWVYALCIGLSLIVIGIVYSLLKRFGVIK